MGGYLILIVVVLVPVMCAHLVAGKLYGPLFGVILGFAGITFLVLLLLINEKFPFASGGDDLGYFDASHQSFTSLEDWFDTARYESSHEQAGYPLLLAWVHQFSGPSLFHLKAVNLFFMLQIAIVWFAIGNVLGGKRMAFIYACGMLLATPLWVYSFFLGKDMTITLLQSIFVLGLILFVSGEHRFRGCALIALSTLAVIPFRSMLAVLNVAVLITCTFLPGRSGTSEAIFCTRLTLVVSLIFGLWLFSTQPGMMATLGVTGEHRSLSAEAVLAQIERTEEWRQPFVQNPLVFPVLFLLGETDALNPDNWGRFGIDDLRPLSMVPWIFLGLPFFLVGIAIVIRRTRVWNVFASIVGHNNAGKSDLTRQQTSSLMALAAFIVAYAAYGSLSGATVRWTLPAIPAMVGIAGFAWANMNGHARLRLITTFDFSFATLILIYYLVLK